MFSLVSCDIYRFGNLWKRPEVGYDQNSLQTERLKNILELIGCLGILSLIVAARYIIFEAMMYMIVLVIAVAAVLALMQAVDSDAETTGLLLRIDDDTPRSLVIRGFGSNSSRMVTPIKPQLRPHMVKREWALNSLTEIDQKADAEFEISDPVRNEMDSNRVTDTAVDAKQLTNVHDSGMTDYEKLIHVAVPINSQSEEEPLEAEVATDPLQFVTDTGSSSFAKLQSTDVHPAEPVDLQLEEQHVEAEIATDGTSLFSETTNAPVQKLVDNQDFGWEDAQPSRVQSPRRPTIPEEPAEVKAVGTRNDQESQRSTEADQKSSGDSSECNESTTESIEVPEQSKIQIPQPQEVVDSMASESSEVPLKPNELETTEVQNLQPVKVQAPNPPKISNSSRTTTSYIMRRFRKY